MEPNTSTVTHVTVPGHGAVSVKIERGQKGTYAWEARVELPIAGNDWSHRQEAGDTLVEVIGYVDRKLRAEYLTPAEGE